MAHTEWRNTWLELVFTPNIENPIYEPTVLDDFWVLNDPNDKFSFHD